MPQMSPLFWVFLMFIFILFYSLYVISFYFKYFCSLNLSKLEFLSNSEFFLVL